MKETVLWLLLNLCVNKQGDKISLTNVIVQEDVQYCHKSGLHKSVITYRCGGINSFLI